MGRKLVETPIGGTGERPGAIAVPATRQDHPSVSSTSEALIALAEEFGRLLARQELARPYRRRGSSLPEVLVGAVIMALFWLLVAHLLSWSPR